MMLKERRMCSLRNVRRAHVRTAAAMTMCSLVSASCTRERVSQKADTEAVAVKARDGVALSPPDSNGAAVAGRDGGGSTRTIDSGSAIESLDAGLVTTSYCALFRQLAAFDVNGWRASRDYRDHTGYSRTWKIPRTKELWGGDVYCSATLDRDDFADLTLASPGGSVTAKTACSLVHGVSDEDVVPFSRALTKQLLACGPWKVRADIGHVSEKDQSEANDFPAWGGGIPFETKAILTASDDSYPSTEARLFVNFDLGPGGRPRGVHIESGSMDIVVLRVIGTAHPTTLKDATSDADDGTSMRASLDAAALTLTPIATDAGRP